MTEITPKDSRYVPFTQQSSCCVPTCLSIIMYKRGIALIPLEELGYHLGLVVSDERELLFWNPRTGERPPTGYGTQIYREEFDINRALKKLNIPLRMIFHPVDDFNSEGDLRDFLSQKIKEDKDLMVCFDHGELKGDHKQGGHVCVFDRVMDQEIRLIDPGYDQPKWRIVKISLLLKAMRKHTASGVAGVWEFISAKG